VTFTASSRHSQAKATLPLRLDGGQRDVQMYLLAACITLWPATAARHMSGMRACMLTCRAAGVDSCMRVESRSHASASKQPPAAAAYLLSGAVFHTTHAAAALFGGSHLPDAGARWSEIETCARQRFMAQHDLTLAHLSADSAVAYPRSVTMRRRCR
jgi:hypothetical protein